MDERQLVQSPYRGTYLLASGRIIPLNARMPAFRDRVMRWRLTTSTRFPKTQPEIMPAIIQTGTVYPT